MPPSSYPVSPRYDEATGVAGQIEGVRTAVTAALGQYLELDERMRAFEDTFSGQILGAAGELFRLRAQRKRLEAAYGRIQAKMADEEYRGSERMRDEVEAALVDPDDAEPDAGSERFGPESEADDAEEFDATARERIYRAFRRIVLPRVHADTSDADLSEFEVAYAAYQSRDYTLMEAFVIRYRDAVELDDGGGPLTTADLKARLREYRAAWRRLDARLDILRRRSSAAELETPEQAREQMIDQGEKLREAITEEAEHVRRLRILLESLVRSADGEKRTEDG